ncbi:MAG: GNAT family N-acetyltransferase [Acidobacteria bacterium]|nr:GNAT family N-acetyltransferase [Acidobacteriota bacterium]
MDAIDPLTTDIVVRNLRPSDLEAVIRLDAKNVGRRRDEFFKLKLKQALSDTGITVSLAAELQGIFVGFLLARVFYGEFGVTERVAVLDVIDVHPDFRGHHVAASLLAQLRTNLLGLGITTLRTEAGWDSHDLLAFFRHEGFVMAQRLCLDLDLKATQARADR